MDGCHEALAARTKFAEHGVGVLAADFDVRFAGKGEAVGVVYNPNVTKHAAEDCPCEGRAAVLFRWANRRAAKPGVCPAAQRRSDLLDRCGELEPGPERPQNIVSVR